MILEENFELNETVVYLVETLNHIQRLSNTKLEDLSEECDQITFESIRNRIDLSIKVCLIQFESKIEQKLAQFRIFSYLISNYFENKTIIDAPKLNYDLIISLAVKNRFYELIEVI
jgi:hypothetical protein